MKQLNTKHLLYVAGALLLALGAAAFVLRTGWFVTPHIVAEFRRGVGDSMRNGHLELSVPMTVHKAGTYLVQANLQQKEGDRAFIAHSTLQGELKQGLQVRAPVQHDRSFRARSEPLESSGSEWRDCTPAH